MTNKIVGAGVLAVLLAANGADAQTTGAQSTGSPGAGTRRAFIEGTAMADFDQTDFEPTGPVFAIGFGIGSKLWERYSLRFDYESPTEHVDHTISPGSEYRSASTTTAYAFLMGRHFRTTRRAPVVLLIGVTALTHRTELTGFLTLAILETDYFPGGNEFSRSSRRELKSCQRRSSLVSCVETSVSWARNSDSRSRRPDRRFTSCARNS